MRVHNPLHSPVMRPSPPGMPDEIAAWKAQQRTAMATQLQLEEESLGRLEAAAAAAADGKDIRVHGMRGPLPEEDEDEAQYDKPGLVKVSGSVDVCHLLNGGPVTCV